MTGAEQGFLLLRSHLGDPERKVLTASQLRTLAVRAGNMALPAGERELRGEDLLALGYDRITAHRILSLLSDTAQLQWYLRKGESAGCRPITRVSAGYPARLRQTLGQDSPGCLWAKGDMSLLDKPAISLVGSRDLAQPNREFARMAGTQAARQGYVLVSGNARGADREAQEACLEAGGSVISVVADDLLRHPPRERMLYLCEEGFDLGFSKIRALSRNRVIHALGSVTLVAQCGMGKGGTWDGTLRNLRHGWSPVFCFHDGSEAASELVRRGAERICLTQLENIQALQTNTMNFIDQ